MLGLSTARLRGMATPFSFARTEIGYLTTVNRIVAEVHNLRQEFNIEPRVLVLGRSEYTNLLRYTHQKPANRGSGNGPTGIIREFMGMQVVVVNQERLLFVSPDIEDLFGIRSC